jgi:hypothetical protein
MHCGQRPERRPLDAARGGYRMVEAIQDKWAIVAAVVVLVAALIVWIYARR